MIGGFPLGFWFAQQGSIYTFVVLIFVYIFGHAEDGQGVRRPRVERGPQANRLNTPCNKARIKCRSKLDIHHGRVTFGIYVIIAWASRVKDTRGFYVAGGGVPPLANGMATAPDWMSAASFISMAGMIFLHGL